MERAPNAPMMSKPKRPSGKSKNPSRNNNLRDPTVSELHNGPTREQLPETVRNNARSETVCKFCGVSYLVFSEIKDLEKRLASAEEKLLEHRKKAQKFDVLQKKVHELIAAQQQHTEKYATLQRRSANLEACVYEKEEELGRAHTDAQRMKSKVSGVRAALARERINVENLKMKTIRTLSDMGTLMKSTQHEIAVVGTRLKREEELRLLAEKELKTTTEELLNEKVMTVSLNENIIELKKALLDLEQTCKNEIKELQQQQNQTIEIMKEQHQQRIQTNQNIAMQEIKDVKEKYETEISNLTNQLTSLQTRCTTAEVQLKEEQNISQERKETIERLELELQHLHKEGSSNTQSLQKQLEELRRQHERLKMIHEMDKKKLINQVSELNVKVTNQEQEIKIQKQHLIELQSTTDSLNTQIVDLLQQLKGLNEELSQLKASLGSNANEQNEEMQRIKAHHIQELKELHDRINTLTNELSDVNGKNEKIQLKIIQTEQNMQELTKKMQRTIDVNVSQIGTLKSKLAAAEGVNLHLKEENMELKKQLLKKNDAIDALVEANLARERAERAAKESNEENMKLKNHLQTSDRTIAELRHALAMKTEENSQLRQASESKNGGGGVDQETIDGIEMLEKHLIKLSEKLRNKNNEVEQLQAVIHRECIQRGRLMDELIELRGV